MALGDFGSVEQPGGLSPSFAIKPSGYVLSKSLVASTAETFTVPPNARIVLLSGNVDFFVDFSGATAAVPGDVTDGSAACLNPSMRSCKGLASISVISADPGIVTAEFWS